VEGADGCAVERAAGLDGDGGRGLVRGAAEGRELAGGLVVGGEGDEPVVAAGEGRGLVVVDGERDGVAIGALLAPALEARFASALGKMTDAQLELLEDHVVVLGYGDLTEPILTELDDRGVEFVVVTPVGDRATALGDRGFHTLVADPSDDDTLRHVHVEAARAVVAATNDDAEDALAVLTARQLNPDVTIVAGVTERDNVDKLRRAGADAVVSPAAIGGRLLVESALGRGDAEAAAERVIDEVGE
jgi:voltage-gated potassium channel